MQTTFQQTYVIDDVHQASLRRGHFPLRYWMLVAYTTGVPTFIRFDETGRTHKNGLFNAYAISQIVLTLSCLFGFVVLTLVSRQKFFARPVKFQFSLWIALLGLFVVASVLEPSFRLSPSKPTDLFVSLYRLLEWVLAFLLLLSLYSRFPREESFAIASGLVARVCWIWIGIVWMVLPLAPSFVFGNAGDTETRSRLGGSLIHPTALGIISSVAGLHAIILLRGTKRLVAVSVSLLTLSLTYARAQEGMMLISLMAYAIFFSKGVVRLLGLTAGGLLALSGVAFAPTVLQYAARGNGLRNIVTLSDRTLVWAAVIEAIKGRPWIGYGFIAGVKGAIKDHWKYAHWLPPHAHNDFLQAILSGGILAGILLLALYFQILRSAIRSTRLDPRGIFFLFVLPQFVSEALLAPLITGNFGVISGLLLFCSVYVIDATHPTAVQCYSAAKLPVPPRLPSVWFLEPTEKPS